MYVPKRAPSAHQVAASQSSFKGCYVYVESGTDCRFWRFFVNDEKVRLHACNGCNNVIETVKASLANGIICIGIIDNDFRSLIDYQESLPINVFTSDDHDIEMMIMKTVAVWQVVTRFDVTGKINAFKITDGDLMEFVYGITDSIGALKLVNKREGLNMVFKKAGKDQTFEMPSYERFLDKYCRYISDDAMIKYLWAWSNDQKKHPTKSVEEIKELLVTERKADHDTYQLSCGHDVSYILAYVIRKRISNRRNITHDMIEELLYVSYSGDSFKLTHLYESINYWGQVHGIEVFK